MRHRKIMLLVLAAAWFASGLFIVRGNELAVVRRLGRVVRTNDGDRSSPIATRSSGLHWDLPWPLATVDRVNIHEVRTVSIGLAELDDIETGQFLQPVDPARQAQFLTGDRNILNLRINISYHVDGEQLEEFLYGSVHPERRLARRAEVVTAHTVAHRDVDFVHVLGRDQLRQTLHRRLDDPDEWQRLGLVVDEVTIENVYPPTQVKSHFLEVMNARAERRTHVNNANAYAQKRKLEADAEARKLTLDARGDSQKTVEAARGEASRFEQLVVRIRDDAGQDYRDYLSARQLTMHRMYLDTMRTVLGRVAGKVVLDSDKPVDLTIIRDPKE